MLLALFRLLACSLCLVALDLFSLVLCFDRFLFGASGGAFVRWLCWDFVDF